MERNLSIAGSSTKSLAIQFVLYQTEPEKIEKSLGNLDHAVAMARRSKSISRVEVLYGDSSPRACITGQKIEILRQMATSIDLLSYHFFDANLGSAGGSNALFAKSSSDLVLILNPDVVTSPGLLQALVTTIAQPSVGIVEGRQLPVEHPKDYDEKTLDTSWASGACMMLRREVIERTGGFDSSSFFMYCDDVDLSWRAQLAGYRVLFVPSACAFHDKRLHADGSMIVSDAEVYYCAEAALMLAYKYSRDDILSRVKTDLAKNGNHLQRKALAEFKCRVDEGILPKRIDADHKVGRFINYAYAHHRW